MNLWPLAKLKMCRTMCSTPETVIVTMEATVLCLTLGDLWTHMAMEDNIVDQEFCYQKMKGCVNIFLGYFCQEHNGMTLELAPRCSSSFVSLGSRSRKLIYMALHSRFKCVSYWCCVIWTVRISYVLLRTYSEGHNHSINTVSQKTK